MASTCEDSTLGRNTTADSHEASKKDAIGSEAWKGDDPDQHGPEFTKRAEKFRETTNWTALLSHASRLRNGLSCELEDSYSVGCINMVRRINFADGVTWVARLRLPLIPIHNAENRECLDCVSIVKSEIATMILLRFKISVPVPEVFGYNVDLENDVGALYIFMSYIHGTIASDLASAKDLPYGQYGTPGQSLRFREQLATIQMELSQISFSQIGMVYQAHEGSFYIGPEVDTGKGPWDDALEYYRETAAHQRHYAATNNPSEASIKHSNAFYGLFNKIVERICNKQASRGEEKSFGLANRDFGPHNVLVNDSFEIVGFIDFDGVLAAPRAVQAQYPRYMGYLRLETPIRDITDPYYQENLQKSRPERITYNNFLRVASASLGDAALLVKPVDLSDTMESDAAVVVYGMWEYPQRGAYRKEEWMEAYKMILEKYSVRARVRGYAERILRRLADFGRMILVALRLRKPQPTEEDDSCDGDSQV